VLIIIMEVIFTLRTILIFLVCSIDVATYSAVEVVIGSVHKLLKHRLFQYIMGSTVNQ